MKLWFGICAALLFGAGVATGMLIQADRVSGPAVDGDASPDVAEGGSIFDADPAYPLYLVTSDRVYAELKLRPDQTRRLEDLFAAHLRQLRQLQAGIAELGGRLREGIVSVLDEEQREIFARIQRRYSDEKLMRFVNRRIDDLRRELQLAIHQEPYIHGAVFDSYSKMKELWCRRDSIAPEVLEKQFDEIRQERDRGVEEQLQADQLEAYRAFKQRDRHWRDRTRDEHGEKAAPES